MNREERRGPIRVDEDARMKRMPGREILKLRCISFNNSQEFDSGTTEKRRSGLPESSAPKHTPFRPKPPLYFWLIPFLL